MTHRCQIKLTAPYSDFYDQNLFSFNDTLKTIGKFQQLFNLNLDYELKS